MRAKTKKQFKTKEDLDKWLNDRFPEEEKEWTFENVIKSFSNESYDPKAVALKLIEEGYDLDDLIADGESYQIDGHTNNGWSWAYKDDLKYLESVGTDMTKIRVKEYTSFSDLFEQTGMSLKQFGEYFYIPYRTLQGWKAGERKCPAYLLDLMAYKLKNESLI